MRISDWSSDVCSSDLDRSNFAIEPHAHVQGNLTVGTDRVELDAHGLANTHLHGLTHMGIDGCWHGGVPTDSIHADDASLIAWAATGLRTPADLVDLPAPRGAAWIELGAPAQGGEYVGGPAATGGPRRHSDPP